MTLGVKLLLLGLQCVVLMIGTLIVYGMTSDRRDKEERVSDEISKEWGNGLLIGGLYCSFDYNMHYAFDIADYECDVKVDTKRLHRGIYEAEVYDTDVNIRATVETKDCPRSWYSPEYLYVFLFYPDQKMGKLSELKAGNQTIEWKPQSNGYMAKVPTGADSWSALPATIELSLSFSSRGARYIYVNQSGRHSVITMEGTASQPSFQGRLPNERSIDGNRFTARWDTYDNTPWNPYQDNGPGERPYRTAYGMENPGSFVGAGFLVGVDRYQKVERSLKYSFIIIVLTYISVVIAECIMRRRIPLLNYFLVGVSLVIFYSLLLSLSEIAGFGWGYLAAATMTIVLNTCYLWKVMDSAKGGVILGCILSVLYGGCYIMLNLDSYALLFGSLLLFVALAVMMALTVSAPGRSWNRRQNE